MGLWKRGWKVQENGKQRRSKQDTAKLPFGQHQPRRWHVRYTSSGFDLSRTITTDIHLANHLCQDTVELSAMDYSPVVLLCGAPEQFVPMLALVLNIF